MTKPPSWPPQGRHIFWGHWAFRGCPKVPGLPKGACQVTCWVRAPCSGDPRCALVAPPRRWATGLATGDMRKRDGLDGTPLPTSLFPVRQAKCMAMLLAASISHGVLLGSTLAVRLLAPCLILLVWKAPTECEVTTTISIAFCFSSFAAFIFISFLISVKQTISFIVKWKFASVQHSVLFSCLIYLSKPL